MMIGGLPTGEDWKEMRTYKRNPSKWPVSDLDLRLIPIEYKAEGLPAKFLLPDSYV
jgi:hypothetical protein